MSYATLAEIKTDRNIANTNDDSILIDKLNAATQRIDEYLNRDFQVQTNTTRTFDSCEDTEGLLLWLDDDLCEINSITNGDGTTITSAQYVTKPANETPYYAIKLKGSYGITWQTDDNGDSEDAISISGKWGYSQTPPALVKSVCLELAGYYYVRRQAQDYDVTATPELGQITAPGSGEAAILARLRGLRRL